MNPDTRVAVCCYSGDGHAVAGNLALYQHHECPITILSPEDSKVTITRPGIDSRYAGKAAHIGQDSLDRQIEHLKILLQYPEKYFMVHDADSFTLDPKFPDYLYANPDLVWSNQVNDNIPQHQGTFPKGWPHVAFQPPYFLSRTTIEKMIAAAPSVVTSPMMPFIDYFMVQLTYTAGLPWRRFQGCVCCPYNLAIKLVQTDGISIFHGIKQPAQARALYEGRRQYLTQHTDAPNRRGLKA